MRIKRENVTKKSSTVIGKESSLNEGWLVFLLENPSRVHQEGKTGLSTVWFRKRIRLSVQVEDSCFYHHPSSRKNP